MDIAKINELLATGLSMPKVEKELGAGKDTLRRKLNRLGYHFDKSTRQYVADKEVKEQVTDSIIKSPMNLSPKETTTDKPITDVVIPGYPSTSGSPFATNEIDILRKMIKEYQARDTIQARENEDRGTLGNRNIRVYKEQYDTFATFCKANNITQADALYKAIELLMNTLK